MWRKTLVIGWAWTLAFVPCAMAQEDPSSGRNRVDQIEQLVVDGQDARELIRGLPDELTAAQCARLRELDRAWTAQPAAFHRAHSRELLAVLATCGDARSLAYLHQVFESYPARRSDVAEAISLYAQVSRRRAADWRLLVRALPNVEGVAAESVLNALARYPQRGTNPYWMREVILVGLRLPASAQHHAVRVLTHWAGEEGPLVAETRSTRLSDWQQWFGEQYVDLPPARLPSLSPQSRYEMDEVLTLLAGEPASEEHLANGKQQFSQHCANCHRFGAHGEAMGPDLTSVSGRLDQRQLIQSLLFPSYTIHEEFATRVLLTVDGRTFTGLVQEGADQVSVLTIAGEKVSIPRADVETIVPSPTSSMPDNLLNELEPVQVRDLLLYLQSGR